MNEQNKNELTKNNEEDFIITDRAVEELLKVKKKITFLIIIL